MRLPHREGLARKCAIENDRLEQIGLAHPGQVEARITRLAAQFHSDILAMDIIDLFRATLPEDIV